MLDRHLDLIRRIDRKARIQLGLATPRTAAVGRVALGGGMLDQRERLLDGPIGLIRGSALCLTGEPLAIVRLPGRRGEVFRILAGRSPGVPVGAVEHALRAREPVGGRGGPAGWLVSKLKQVSTLADRAPMHPVARSLSRAVVRRGREAAHRRSTRHLDLLDRVLHQILLGLPVGAERELTSLLETGAMDRLASWCDRWSGRAPELGRPEVVALVQLPRKEVSGYIRVNDRARDRDSSGAAIAKTC